jgi:heterotetrameric sarcosine oxidase gamma subunit
VADAATPIIAPLEGVAAAGRYGRGGGEAGVIIGEERAAGLASLIARRGCCPALSHAARTAFGIELPPPARWAEAPGLALVWSGPDRWLAIKTPAPREGMETHLAGACAGLAAVVDQSHGAMLLRASGRNIRDALAKGVPIDLHPSAFGVGHSAITAVAHISLYIWKTSELPSYALLVPRSYALSFWHWLNASCAEYGLEVARGAGAV